MTQPLGPAGPVEGILDTTGRNPGNYTVTVSPQDMGINLPVFECYHMVIDGPIGSSCDVFIGANWYDSVVNAWKNAWDPAQTMKLQLGQPVYFFWNVAPNATPVPVVTMYFQEASPL